MNERNTKLLFAIGDADEKYVKEANEKMTLSKTLKIAAVFAVVLALSLYLFIPYGAVTSDLSDYEASPYFALIENIEDYRLSSRQPKYKNNFESISASVSQLFDDLAKGDADMNFGGDAADGGAPGASENGNYLESTDNQVAGVIEADLFKMSDNYIFRLDGSCLYVYSIEKEDSSRVSEYLIQSNEGEYFVDSEMYLSEDCNTVTVIGNYKDRYYQNFVKIISLDVSDVNNIKEKGIVTIEGELNTSRMIDGKLLLVTEFYFYGDTIDYSDPLTFVPGVNNGDGEKPIEFEDIIFPETVGNTRYSVVALVDTEELSIVGANAILNFTSDVYVSEENVYISREYTEEIESEYRYAERDMTDVAIISYRGDTLEKRGVLTVRGYAEDQYSFDEKDGYLRLVTSTEERYYTQNDENASFRSEKNVSLYIYELETRELAYSSEDFAIEGEEATAVRFDGDKLYVCTAVVVTFTDPVYFFDLSDYESISSADTGIIEGFSTSLINLGEGFLLGIGRENWSHSKVEVYEERDGAVVSVDKFKFNGDYSEDYKSYLVNREHNLFGFAFYGEFEDREYMDNYYALRYVLLGFDGYGLTVLSDIKLSDGYSAELFRAAFIDGYLYVTTPTQLYVEKVFE